MKTKAKIAPDLEALLRERASALMLSAAEREQFSAMCRVVEAAQAVHARYLRQWTRHQNKSEERLGKALGRLVRASRQEGSDGT
jgi:hypothetical protein